MADEPDMTPEKEYPPYVVTPEQRHRWDVAAEAARNVVPQIGGNDETVWLATRSLYNSDIPTTSEPPAK